MDIDGLADDVAHRHARIEAGERILEDDLHLLPVLAHLLEGQGRDVDTVEDHFARCGLEKPQDRATDRRLAGSGFANEPQHLACADGKRHILDGLNAVDDAREYTAVNREILAQVPHIQKGSRGGGSGRSLQGSRDRHAEGASASISRHLMQRTVWPPPVSSSGGADFRHSSRM